jgi:signal transduction histidine kinase
VMPIMEGHQVTGMVAASRDITETAELERKNREISDRQEQFINDAAHELKTPLAAIQGNLDVLLRYEDIPEDEKKEIFQDVHHSATRLSRLVSSMLQLARADAAISLDEEVPLHAVVHSAWREVQRISSNHHFEAEDIQSIELYGNTDRLKQMTLILLENAVKYTPAGGRIHVSLQHEGQQAILTVQDSGIGIAPEHHHKVFERFFRVDRTRVDARDPGGSGLGLPIARWIVEAHGGQMFLESALGQGSTFKVVLPLEALEQV